MSNNGRAIPVVGELDKAIEITLRAHECLKRWAGRYADSEHAKKQVAETRALMTDIEQWTYETAARKG